MSADVPRRLEVVHCVAPVLVWHAGLSERGCCAVLDLLDMPFCDPVALRVAWLGRVVRYGVVSCYYGKLLRPVRVHVLYVVLPSPLCVGIQG